MDIPTTAAAALVVVLAVLPGVPGDHVYRVLAGVSWRERDAADLLRLLAFSVTGLILYVILASRFRWPSPDYIIPATYSSPSFGGAQLTSLGIAYAGHFAAQKNFMILADLDAVFGPTVAMLLTKEVDQLRHGAAVIPVLDSLDLASTKLQVHELAAGRLESVGADFVARREARIDRDYPETVTRHVRQVRQARAAGAEMPTTFEEVLATFDAQVPRMIRQRLHERVSAMEATELHARLDAFPALRTTVRADLYMTAIAMFHDTGAARDKLDDYRHVIEAAYANVFVTGDQQLARTAPRLNPALQIVTWDDLQAGQ